MIDYRFNHLSVRVPWHDSAWNGHVCRNPLTNSQCSALPYIAEKRNELEEIKDGMPGAEFASLSSPRVPPCIKERSAFLSPNQHTIDVQMPYSIWSRDHAHILPTTMDLPPWGGIVVPFRWMSKDHAWKIGEKLGIDVSVQYEPKSPDWLENTHWVQGIDNQRALLDAFADGLSKSSSLVFFYAKRTPIVDFDSRFLMAVAPLADLGSLKEYPYEGGAPAGRLQALIWERPFQHSIRRAESATYAGGVVLPYSQLMEGAADGEDLSDFAATLPPDDELWTQFSFGSEHVTHQGAAAALWSMKQAAERLSKRVEFDASSTLAWINTELNRIWETRGPYPGLGSALSAFDKSLNGTLFTYALSSLLSDGDDPWSAAHAVLSGAIPLTRPGIFVPAEVRENLMKEGGRDAHAEVQTGADRNDVASD